MENGHGGSKSISRSSLSRVCSCLIARQSISGPWPPSCGDLMFSRFPLTRNIRLPQGIVMHLPSHLVLFWSGGCNRDGRDAMLLLPRWRLVNSGNIRPSLYHRPSVAPERSMHGLDRLVSGIAFPISHASSTVMSCPIYRPNAPRSGGSLNPLRPYPWRFEMCVSRHCQAVDCAVTMEAGLPRQTSVSTR